MILGKKSFIPLEWHFDTRLFFVIPLEWHFDTGKKSFILFLEWHFDADCRFLLRRVYDIHVGPVRFGEGDDFLPKLCDGEVNYSLPKKKQKESKSDAK